MIQSWDDGSFEQGVASKRPVLLDFGARWCGPCKRLEPALEALSKEMGDQLAVARVDIEESPTWVARFGVRAVPTLVLVRDGVTLQRRVGTMSAAELASWVRSALAG